MGPTLFFVFALVAKTFAGPIQEVVIAEQCARQCTVSNKFNYDTGMTYEFAYATELRTAIQGASEDQAGVDLSAKVYIDFHSKCEMVLRLSDVKLTEQIPGTSTMKPVASDLISGLEQNPLTVSFQDGNIEELCLSQPENDKILNIKRGILSMIQNNMDNINKDQTVTERDVSGECVTEYTSTENGRYNKLIKKSKDLLGCTGRQGSNTAIQGIPYTSNSGVQSLPLLRSTHECEQNILKATGQLQSARCIEQHSFAPFSRLDSGATTHNTQTLTLVKQYQLRSKQGQISVRAPIQFQHSIGNSAENARKDMEEKLMEICSKTKDGVTPETPKMFTSLVYIMKAMQSEDLVSIYKKIQNNEICPSNNKRVSKFFLDAIPMSGTIDSLRLMVQLLTSGQVTGIEADMWMTSLAFIQNPSKEMLAEVKSLLSMKNNDEKSMLSVSSLVHTVCKNNPSCGNMLEVKKIISLLESKIAPSCKISEDTFQTSLIALRGIGNAGFGTSASPTLVKCIKRTENPIEIRLSAIEAFRRIPCKADKSDLLSTFSDIEEDSEIRIAAYKALMGCPSDYIISKVKDTLKKEEVNQVGSYVWSHLTNLMETSDPHKQSLKSILDDEILQKEFNMDKRKFSRNYEKSLFIEKLNTGAAAEGDLIWSSKSFIPRSAMVNLTVDLFGNAINLFEIGGRLEGLEYFFESYFGPSGYFSENGSPETVKETAVDVIKSDKVNRIDKRNNRVMAEMRGSMYMKVFGNELRYMNFQGLDHFLSQKNFNVLDMLMKLSKENDYQYTHSAMFMDSSMIVPTSSGFPLNLTVNGTATIDLKASGKMDVMKLTSSPPTLDIHGTIRPSGAVVVSSIMGIDALDTQVGIKMVSTLHSKTSVQGKVSLSEGTVLDVDFDLPEEKQEIISISSSFYTVHRHSEREQKMITQNRQEYNSCSGTKLAKITGLELCGELSFPNASLVENAPYFPLTGPVKAAVTLFKRDKTMSGYKLQVKSSHNLDENIIRLAFSTPNSNIDRNFGIDLSLNKAQGSIDASFNSPWMDADFKGTFQNENSYKGISGKMNWDGTVRFDIKASLQLETSGPGMMYTPTVKISIPGKKTVGLGGYVKYAPWKYFETDMSLDGLTADPISFKTSVQNKAKIMSASANLQFSSKQTYSVDSSIQTTEYKKKIVYKQQLSIRTPSSEVLAFGGTYTNVYGKNIEIDMVLDKVIEEPIRLKANLITKEYRRGRLQKIVKVDFRSKIMDVKMKNKFDNRNGKTFATDTDLTYVIRRIARDNIKLVTKLINLSSKSLTKARASMNFASKRNPASNLKLVSNVNHNKRHSELEADIAYGADFKDVNSQISLSMSVDRAFKSLKEASATLNGKLLVGNDFRIITKLDHSHEPKSLVSNAMLRINKDAVSSSLSLKNSSEELLNLFGEFNLELPGKSIAISQLIKENAPNNYTSTMNARFGKAKNTIVTSWKKISPSALTISSDINLYTVDPLKINAEYSLGPALYKVGGTFQKASSKYNAMVTSQVDLGKSIQISAGLEYPSRRIISNFEGTKAGIRYTSRADLRWNADRDDTQRITINSYGHMSELANSEGSVTIQYPSRTIALNVRNNKGSKYASHIDFQWEPNKIVTFDYTFGDYRKSETGEIISTFKFDTPWIILKSVDVTLNHQINADLYQTKFDVEWNTKNTVSGTMTVRKPLSLESINMDFIGKAPSLGYKTIQTSLQHNVRNGVSTIGKLTLNKKSIQVDLSLTNNGDESQTDFRSQIDVKSSFRQLRTATVTFSHKNNGRRMDTSALLKYNKQQIGVEGTMETSINGFDIKSNGEIIIHLPSNTIRAIWGHRNTNSEMTTTSEITWDNKRISASFKGLQDLSLPVGMLSAAVEIQTPYNLIRDVVLQINHLHKIGQIDSTLKVTNNGNSLVTLEGKYLRENGKVTSRFSASNPFYDGIVAVILNADYENPRKTGHLELSLTPLQTLSLDAQYSKQSNGDLETSLTVSIPNKQPIEILASRQIQGASVNSAVSCKYDTGKVIRLESIHSTGEIKQLKLKFSSPFTKIYSAEVVLQTLQENRRIDANIEAEPFLSKWAMSAALDTSNGISGNLKVNTPYQDVPYSQISVLSDKVDGSRQSTIIVEYRPGNILKLTNMFLFNSITDMQFTVELSTPFETLHYTSAAFRHQGDLSAFSNYGEIEFNKEKISVESKFSLTNGVQSSLSIKSPFTQDISGVLRHDGDITNFISHVEFTWGKTVLADLKHKGSLKSFASSAKISCEDSEYLGNVNFNLGPKMTTDVSINTPIAKFERISFSHSLEGTLNKFSNHAELSTPGYGTVSSDVTADFETTISLIASTQTPLLNFRNMKFVFTHEGSLPRFSTSAEFTNGDSVYSGDMNLNTETGISFESTLKTPFKDYKLSRVSLTNEGSLNNFKFHAEAQLNKATSQLDLICNVQKKYDIDLTIRSPYFETIKASLDHWGSWKKFQSKIDVRSGAKNRIVSNIKFAFKPTFNAMISVKSPFASIKNWQLSLKHAGSPNSFKCNMQYKYNGKTYIGDASFQNLKSLNAELNLKGPTFRPISVVISHDGEIKNFKSSASMSMGKKTVQVDATFNADKDIMSNIGIITPFDGYESIKAVVSHSGDADKFKSHGEVTLNGKSGQIDVSVDATRDISAVITIATPFKGYRDISSSVKYERTMKSFNTLASFSVAEKSFEGHASFQTSPSLSGSASVKSNFQAVDNYDLLFNHEGSWNKFNTNGEVKIGSKSTKATLAYDSTNGYAGSFGIISPFMKKTDIQMQHSSNGNALHTNVFLAQNDVKQYGFQLDLSQEPFSGIATITTPHTGFESTELSVHHDGTINDFRSNAAFEIFGKKYEGEISFEATPDMQASLSLRSPLFDDTEVRVSTQGPHTNFNFKFNYLYGKQNKMLIETNLNIDGPYSGNIKIVSPFMKSFEASFSHNNNLNDLTSVAQFMYSGEKTDIQITARSNPKVEITLRLTSPFTEELNVKLSHSGPWTNCKSQGTITYGGITHLSVDGLFEHSTDLNGELRISTSVPGFKLFSTKFSHSGDLSGFQCHGQLALEEKSASGDIKYSPNEGQLAISTPFTENIDASYTYNSDEASLRVSAPFIKDIKGSYKMNGNLLKSVSEAELSYGRTKLIAVQGNMNYPNSGEVSFQTALKELENCRIELTRDGDFGGNVVFELNGVRHQGNIFIDTNNKLSVSSSLNSPLFPQMSYRMYFSGELSNFKSNAKFTLQGDTHATDVQFSMKRNIEGSMTITSPLISDISLTFNTNQDLTDLVSSVDLSFDTKKILSIQSAFINKRRKAGTIDIVFTENTFNAAYNFDGAITDFIAHAEATVNNMKTEGDATFRLTPLSASISLKTPLTEPVKAAFNVDGSLEEFKGQLLLLEYGQETLASSEITFSKYPMKAAVSIKTPFVGYKTISVLFTHSGDVLNFNNHAEIIIENQKSQIDMTFNFGSKLEGRISASSPTFPPTEAGFGFSGTPSKFSSNAEIIFTDAKYSVDASVDTTLGIDAHAEIHTPFEGYRTITSKITHTGHYPKIDTFAQVKTGRRNLFTGSAKVDNINGIDGEFSVQSIITPTVQINMKHTGKLSDFSTNAEFRINGKPTIASMGFKTQPSLSGTIAVTTPFTTPISGSFNLRSINNDIGVHFEGNLDRQSIVGDASVKYGNEIVITAAVKTPFAGLENMKGSIRHVSTYKGFESSADLEIFGNKLQAEAESSWRDIVTGSVSVRTPFELFRHTSADLSFSGNFPNVQTKMNVFYAEQKYSVNAAVDNTNARLVIKTPLKGFEDLSASFKYENSNNNIHTEARVTFMSGEEVFASFQNTLTDDRLQTKAKLETPYTEDISMELTLKGKLSDFSSTFIASMGDANTVSSISTFKLGDTSVDFDANVKSILAGYSDEQRLSLTYEGILPNIKASANAKFLGSYFAFDSSLQVDDSIIGMFTLRTPFVHMRDIALNFEHTGLSRRFSTKTEFQYDTNKKIEGSFQFIKYGWRRLQTSLNVRTPFAGFETSKISYRHTASVDSFECDADFSFMNKDVNGLLRASMEPLSASVSISTPIAGFEQIGADTKLTYDTRSFNAEANVQYMQGKKVSLLSNADITSSPKTAMLKLSTPFKGFESSEIRVSSSGNLGNFQSSMAVSSPFTSSVQVQANMKYVSLRDIDGSISFSSQIKNFERLLFTLKNDASRGNLNSNMQVSWAPSKSIRFAGTFTDNSNVMSTDVSLTTPFQVMRQLSLHSKTENRGAVYTEKFTADFNGNRIADMDISADLGEKKSVSWQIRSPMTLLLELHGSMLNKYEAGLTVSKNIENTNAGVKIDGIFDPSTNRVSINYRCPRNTISFDGTFDIYNNKIDFVKDGIRYGYDMVASNNKGQLKITLPTRSLQISGSQISGNTEGAFLWDADKDDTKQIGFRSVLRPKSDSVEADVTIMMPSIGKEVQIDSQMSVNKGHILFDGKTELTYSRDSRKKFTVMSRLEDISNSLSSKNYSFTFGISHPYTSVDVQVSTQFGNSNQKMTGGLDMKYKTVRREIKTFSVYGALDKVRNAFSINMNSPMKKIGINGNAQTYSPYQLSLTNNYDAKHPLNTLFSFDTNKPSVDFQMNYDLDNPGSEFHFSAKYVNSSALAAEVFHVVNRQRVTDVLFTLRLNSSSLLHSRVHWRPDLITDLKELSQRKINSYGRRIRNFADIASVNMKNEVGQKARLISESFNEEVQPISVIVQENLKTVSEMYENNEYHIRDTADIAMEAAYNARVKLDQMSEISKEFISRVKDKLEKSLSSNMESYKEQFQATLLKLEDASAHITLQTGGLYRKYYDHAYNISKPIVHTVNDKYNKYVQYMSQINVSPVSGIAEKYTSAIYGARDVINAGLASLMDRNDVKYVKSISDGAFQQGHNAYKYWEIRENSEIVARAVADWIRDEIEKEISDIKTTVLNLMKSKVTVYDPSNGEIQMEFYLPIPLKSLDVVPKIDFMPYIAKARSYVPQMPSLYLPSADIRTWLPPFDALATIQGNKVSTFDGLTYDLDSSCTYMLARDFVNSNFSVVLNKDGDNKTLIIVKGDTPIKLFSNGLVTVNEKPVELPVILNGVTISSLDGHVAVSVAGHLSVDYYQGLDKYMVKLNGYYYGKTNGILGSYDNEPSNDLMTSFGKLTDSADRFAKTWDIGTERCR